MDLLFSVSVINVLHNIFAFIAIYVSFLNPDRTDTIRSFWILQALCAASIRIVELCINYLITGSLGTVLEKKAMMFVSGLAGIGVIFGRITDVIVADMSKESDVPKNRLGMTIVSASCFLSSMLGLFIIRNSVQDLDVSFIDI
jgi:hypothetical protein